MYSSKKNNLLFPLLLALGLISAVTSQADSAAAGARQSTGTPSSYRNTTISEITRSVPLFGAAFSANIFSIQRRFYKYGLPIAYVKENSPAERAGIREGDVLLTFDGQKIFYANQFAALLRTYKPDDSVKIEFARGDEIFSPTLKLGTRYGQSVERPTGIGPDPALADHDDVRIVVNGREISLSKSSDWSNRIAVTKDAVIIRTGTNFPHDIQTIVDRFRSRLPDPQAISKRIDRTIRSFRTDLINGISTWSQIFSSNGKTVILSQEGETREVVVRTKKDGEIFRGPCSTQEEIDAIPENALTIIREFTALEPIENENAEKNADKK